MVEYGSVHSDVRTYVQILSNNSTAPELQQYCTVKSIIYEQNLVQVLMDRLRSR